MEYLANVKIFFEGKKSYLIAFVIFVLGGLQAVGVEVPDSVYAILGGLLGISLRAGINKA